jgi:hypothetical protein
MYNDFIKFISSQAFDDFSLLFFRKTGKTLESVEELLDAISNKTITCEELFDERLNHIEFSEQAEDYWLSNLEHFSYENYFPPLEKQAKQGGVWIKVRTEKGFKIHLAKKANRKINLSDDAFASLAIWKKNLLNTDAQKKVWHKVVLQIIGIQPYELFYYKTRTRKVYITPCEYEIVDINEWIENVQSGSLKGFLTVHSLFTSDSKEKAFYLQSRGINKELALILANLSQCYFDFNFVKAYNAYGEVHNAKVAKALSN